MFSDSLECLLYWGSIVNTGPVSHASTELPYSLLIVWLLTVANLQARTAELRLMTAWQKPFIICSPEPENTYVGTTSLFFCNRQAHKIGIKQVPKGLITSFLILPAQHRQPTTVSFKDTNQNSFGVLDISYHLVHSARTTVFWYGIFCSSV